MTCLKAHPMKEKASYARAAYVGLEKLGEKEDELGLNCAVLSEGR